MSKTWTRGFAVSLAVLFLSSAVFAQEPEKQTPIPTTPKADCEPNNCISKVLHVPEFSTPFELQDVVNTFRSIADFTTNRNRFVGTLPNVRLRIECATITPQQSA